MKARIPLIIIAALLLFPAASSGEGARNSGASCAGAAALKKEAIILTVEQGYFIKSIRHGTGMSACPSFNGRSITEGVEAGASRGKSWQDDAAAGQVKATHTEQGERLFALCGGCHGLEGEGAMGPPLLDAGFLESISDSELRRIITLGKPGTPMKGFLRGTGGSFSVLSREEIDAIISYMRYRHSAGGLKDAERIKAP